MITMRPSSSRRRRILIATQVSLVLMWQGVGPTSAALIDFDWTGPAGTGGAGPWDGVVHWEIDGAPVGQFPDNQVDGHVARIGPNGLAGSPSLTGLTVDIAGLQISPGSDTRLRNSSRITLEKSTGGEGGTISNDGTILLIDSSAFGTATLRIDGDTLLEGTGQIQFTSAFDNILTSVAAADLLTNTGNTITAIGPTAVGTIRTAVDNQATVSADAGALTITDRDWTNTGTISAVNGGQLTINPLTIQNAGGIIEVDATSTLTLDDTIIEGGTLQGGGTVDLATGVTQLRQLALLQDLTFTTVNNTELRLQTAAPASNVVIHLSDDNGGGDAELRIDGDVTLDGTSSILFTTGPETGFRSNLIRSLNSTDRLTFNGTSIRTEGSGDAGEIRSLLTNTGTVSADAGTIRLTTHD